MRLNFILLAVVTIGILAATYFLSQPAQPNFRDVPVSAIEPISNFPLAPNVALTDLEGKAYQLHDFKGKTIVLNFWASWCTPCLVEFPQLLALAERKQNDLVFIAVTVDADKGNITKYFNRLNDIAQQQLDANNVYIIWDPNKKISQDTFQTIRYPETLIIAPDLTLRQKIIGASVDFASEGFIAELEEAVK